MSLSTRKISLIAQKLACFLHVWSLMREEKSRKLLHEKCPASGKLKVCREICAIFALKWAYMLTKAQEKMVLAYWPICTAGCVTKRFFSGVVFWRFFPLSFLCLMSKNVNILINNKTFYGLKKGPWILAMPP